MPVNTIDRFSDYKIDRSITVLGNLSDAVDYNSPLDFKAWLSYFKNNSVSLETFKSSYQKYLTSWNVVKNTFLLNQNDDVKQQYVSLLEQISLDVFTEQERKYLKSIDYKDSQQLDTIVPLVASKIKSLTSYYKNFRETVKTQPRRNNIFSSNIGITSFLTKLISDLLNYNSDTISLAHRYGTNKDFVLGNVNYVIDELYDNYDDYFDLTASEPASAYEYGGKERTEQWNSNTNPWDPDLFINYDNSVVKTLSSYNYILENFISNLSFPVSLKSSEVEYLKNKDFINQFNDGDINNLNLTNKKALFEKFIGTDWYFLTAGETTNDVLSGKLISAKNISQNFLNRNNVSTATLPNTAFLVSEKDIGGFYKPSNLGTLIYNVFKFNYNINYQALSGNTIYYFPDPTKYIGTYGNSKFTKSTFDIFDVNENAYIVNYDVSNSAAFGYINDDSFYLNFHGYENVEEKNQIYSTGVSRNYDKVEFFKGKGDIWSNNDIYNIDNKALYPIDERQNDLIVGNNSLVYSSSDVYGNSIGLLKDSNRSLFTNLTSSYADVTHRCLFLSNGLFVKNNAPFNYNSAIDGDYGEFITEILPSQSFTASLCSLGDLLFTSDTDSRLFNGTFTMPWCFSSSTIYNRGNTYDGAFYSSFDGKLLPDTPSSDSPSWNENLQSLYYNKLLDGASDSSGNRPNFLRTATFLKSLSSTLDCGKFDYVNQTDPFVITNVETKRFEKIKHYDTILDGLSTQYVNVDSSTNKSIYSKKYELSSYSYFRDLNNSVLPLSAALSSVFIKYSSVPEIYNELNNNIIKLDTVFDVAIIETNNYQVIEKIDYDYNTGKVQSYNSSLNYISRTTSDDKNLEKFGNFYFHEKTNTLLFNKTSVHATLSSSNYKYLYPTIYKMELDSLNLKQIFPKSTKSLIYRELSSYSFRTVNNINSSFVDNTDPFYNVYEVDRPVLTYDSETNTYTYVIKSIDMSDCIAFYYQNYKFIDGKFQNVDNEIYFQNSKIRDENYSNPLTASFIDYNYLDGTQQSIWLESEGVLKLGEQQ